MGRKQIEINKGDEYGFLEIIEELEPHIEPNGNKTRMVKCKCNKCGNEEVVVRLSELRRGKTKSCGCLQKEMAGRKSGIPNTKNITTQQKSKTNTYDLSGEYGIGYTDDGYEFWFDLEDYDLIKKYKWYKNQGYLQTIDKETNKTIRMHRFLMNCPEDMLVDHIDNNRSNNCKSNLRFCTQSENARNRKIGKNNVSGVTGVSRSINGKRWIAKIKFNRKNIHLGTFDTKEEAIQARKNAEIKYFGEFRNVN